MLVQSINSANTNNPNFGLKISKHAAVAIIDEYKQLGASDEQIVYYLKDLKTSKPDRFELQNVAFEKEVKSTPNGDKLFLKTKMWLSDGRKSGEFTMPRTYEYEGNKAGNYTNAETKAFYLEHLTKAVNKATERIQHSSFQPSPLFKYREIIKKSEV
ncbi:MAG: hypothetical protein E7Z93_01485 [Cyanobacteria bacterium SIG32]|nr:hypothetical protein [Cyanobacteria bacterium SIG32]